MEPIHLFDLAAKKTRWLSTSQATIAGNVSNANTPGYRAQSVQPFSEILDRTQLPMTATSPNHLEFSALSDPAVTVKEDTGWETTESGNSVSLENELIKAGEVQRDYSMNTNIVKAFHAMLMSSVKG